MICPTIKNRVLESSLENVVFKIHYLLFMQFLNMRQSIYEMIGQHQTTTNFRTPKNSHHFIYNNYL